MTYTVLVKYQDNNKTIHIENVSSLEEAMNTGLQLADTFDQIEIYVDNALCYVADRYTNFDFITI